MEGFHHDAHQQLCTSTQLEGRELIHLGQKPHAADVSFADLPQPWWKLLVHQVEPKHRHALFRTCSGIAAAVVQHSTRLRLEPHEALQQDSSRRAFVLKLAANSNNIQLYASSVPLDVSDVWQSIKQLVLCDPGLTETGLTADTIRTLHLQQLRHLNTITLVSYGGCPAVDTAAVQRLMQVDALPALRTLECIGMPPTVENQLLQQLGPVLGHRITKLLVHSCLAAATIGMWPGLQRVKVQAAEGCYETSAAHSSVVKQVFEHPQLKEAVVPSHMFSLASSTSNATFQAGKLDVLELTDQAGIILTALCHTPLHAVKQLRVHTGIRTASSITVAAVQHLCQCSQAEIVPSDWTNVAGRYDIFSIAGSTPTLKASFDPLLLEWLLAHISKAEGALILSNDPEGHDQCPIGRQHIACLHLLPPGIHTLVLDRCAVATDCTWGQLVAQVPEQVQSLLIYHCAMTQEQFEGVLARPPPAGLQRLDVVYSYGATPWAGKLDWAVAATDKWAGVQIRAPDWDMSESEEEDEEEWEDPDDDDDDYGDLEQEPDDEYQDDDGDLIM